MLTEAELKWIRQAMSVEFESAMAKAKVYRTIGQIFELAAQRIEKNLVDKVEERLYN